MSAPPSGAAVDVRNPNAHSAATPDLAEEETGPSTQSTALSDLDYEIFLRREIYADILICPGVERTIFTKELSEPGVSIPNALRKKLAAIERIFGRRFFAAGSEFDEFRVEFRSRCRELIKEISVHPFASLGNLSSLAPELVEKFQDIVQDFVESLNSWPDKLRGQEMEARRGTFATDWSIPTNAQFIFYNGICMVSRYNGKFSKLYLSTNDIAGALIREFHRRPDWDVPNPIIPRLLDDLFPRHLKRCKEALEFWAPTMEEIRRTYGKRLEFESQRIAKRFGKEVVTNPESIFQRNLLACRVFVFKLMNPYTFEPRLQRAVIGKVKWLVRSMRYLYGLLLKDTFEELLEDFLEKNTKLEISGDLEDIVIDPIEVSGGVYNRKRWGRQYWDTLSKEVSSERQRALRAKRPPRLLAFALDRHLEKVLPDHNSEEPLSDTEQSAFEKLMDLGPHTPPAAQVSASASETDEGRPSRWEDVNMYEEFISVDADEYTPAKETKRIRSESWRIAGVAAFEDNCDQYGASSERWNEEANNQENDGSSNGM
ncbi:hypothetical protein EG329_000976 [Mollisiaceae sp. DMI_Dod_QoI]|nr:hypothetical protein EG329_000976 [Helotiales sp. DMI_Dod_QoI]